MKELIETRIAALKSLSTEAARATGLKDKIYPILQASDCLLIEAYKHSLQQSGLTPPADLTSGSTAGGYMELGPVLYWLNNPPTDFIGDVVKAIVGVLEAIEGPLPNSKITPGEYANIVNQAETAGVVAPDGTIYGEHTYEQLDPLWLLAFFYFLYYQADHGAIHPFGATPQVFNLPKQDGGITVAIVGDWGTGKYDSDGGPAITVMADIVSLKPDYIVHLGDVYYAGTTWEESGNFVDLWPKAYASGQSFTLNSNHEMYDGANGYFKTALGSRAPFAHQKNTSYFALTYGDWVVIGLDSAYYAAPDKFYMYGGLDGSNGAQAKWVRSHFGARQGKNVIVLTHHNGLDYTGENLESPLWAEVVGAVGGDGPAYWYWGHIHDGIVYSDECKAGSAVKVRCVGHGAIPFGTAWGLEPLPNPRVEYFAHTSIDGSIKVRNGFATITFTNDGGLTENFYETTGTPGKPKQVWP